MERFAVGFAGQCHTVGYPGVPPDASFPEVFRTAVQASRPHLHVEILIEPFYHPTELADAVRRLLQRRTQVVVIEVVGWLAIHGPSNLDLTRLPRFIRSTCERVRHFKRASESISSSTRDGGLIYKVQLNAIAAASNVMRPLFPTFPRATPLAYESCLVETLAMLRPVSGTSVVIEGPGAPNQELDWKTIASDAIERSREVNEMARRVAAAHHVLFVERWDTVASGFFLPGDARPSAKGHSIWGHLLAEELLAAGVI
jgi:hypothetical protein